MTNTGIKRHLRQQLTSLLLKSLQAAIKEQGFKKLASLLCEIVPDITGQYTMFEVNTDYLNTKVRGLHAFQISIANKLLQEFDKPVLVDIGDSAGTHLQYLTGLNSGKKDIQCLSVNLDPKAVERIRKKGLGAVCARAEDLHLYNIEADIFLCFEMLEHLMNPCSFLHQLSSGTTAKYLIITVPYMERSRIGLHHIRNNKKDNVNAENTHIFELNPEDWKLIINHSGWSVVEEVIYRQYPRKGIMRITQPLWKKYDFEGFYGMILERNDTWSVKYTDW